MKIKSNVKKKRYVYLLAYELNDLSNDQIQEFYESVRNAAEENLSSSEVFLVTYDGDDLDLKKQEEVFDSDDLPESCFEEGKLVFSLVLSDKDFWDDGFPVMSKLSKAKMMAIGPYPKHDDDTQVREVYKSGKAVEGFHSAEWDYKDEYIFDEEDWPFKTIGFEIFDLDYYPESDAGDGGKSSTSKPKASAAWPMPGAHDDEDGEDQDEDEEEGDTYEFTSQELTVSLFTYTIDEFKKIKIKKELAEWQEEFESNSNAYPLMSSSPFGENDLSLDTSIDEEPESDKIYVAICNYYMSSDYVLEHKIDSSCVVKLAPIVGRLFSEGPMDWIESDGESVYFEGQGATDGTETYINFYYGETLVHSVSVEDIDQSSIQEVLNNI